MELAQMRDAWQVLTTRTEDLDNILGMSLSEVNKHLEYYHSPTAAKQMLEWLVSRTDWRAYYADHPDLDMPGYPARAPKVKVKNGYIH